MGGGFVISESQTLTVHNYLDAMDVIHAGKNILCEKSLTINAKEAEMLIQTAKKQGVYLMESQHCTQKVMTGLLTKSTRVDEGFPNNFLTPRNYSP